MRYLSLFSGIEAASAAWASLGWECAAVAEVEPFPCAALAHHHPEVPNLGDVTKITEADIRALGHVDLVVFGSPCQDLSVAGQRKGLINERGDITRSGLFFTAINIFHWSGARFALWENVPGAFSSGKGRDFASVVSFMAGLDDVDVPPNGWGTEGAALGDNGLLEWGTLDAQWFGVAQRRRRVFALLDTGDWAGRPPILLEPESLRGDTAPRRETGEGFTHPVAPCIGASGRGFERGGDTRGQDAVVAQPFTVAHSLRGEGFDASEDGTGRGAPLVPVHCRDVAGAITSNYGKQVDSSDTALGPNVIAIRTGNTSANGHGVSEGVAHTLDQAQGQAIAFVQNTRDEVRLMNGDGQIIGALAAEAGMKQQCYVAMPHVQTVPTMQTGSGNPSGHGARSGDTKDAYIVPVALRIDATSKHSNDLAFTLTQPSPSGGGHPQAVAYAFQPRVARNGRGDMGEVVNALNAQSGETGKGDAAPCVATPMRVRRLTPVECERLQGFPDGHTAIVYRGKPAADGPRYKALGNSMAVPVMRHIGIKIMEAVWN